MKLKLCSDGGGQRTGSGAGACILESEEGKQLRLLIYLGPATNNEAEISAGLIGFAAIAQGLFPEANQVIWLADSEYTLKSATGYINNWQKNGWQTAQKKPVKNQGLWRAYLKVSKGLKISTEHVKGHSGHIENELCDQASTWAQNNAEFYLEQSGTGLVSDAALEEEWFLIDGREYLEFLREGQVEPGLEILLAALEHSRGIKQTALAKQGDPLSQACKEFEKLIAKTRKSSKEDSCVQDMLSKITAVLEECKVN